MVGLTKNALRKAIGRAFLCTEDFITLLAEVEGVINSRPLCYVAADSLTTMHHSWTLFEC